MKHVQSKCPHIIPDMTNITEDGRYKCPLCPFMIRVTETKRHKIMRHVDTLLTSYKLGHLTRAEFKEYCDHVFKVELLLCGRTPGQNGMEKVKCLHCSKSYLSNYAAHDHLFLAHKQVMGKKLVELQKSTGLEEIRGTSLPSDYFQNRDRSGEGRRPRPRKRTFPGNSSATQEELLLQDAVWADEDTPATKKLPPESRGVLCTLCDPHRHMKMKELKRHKTRHHVETFLTAHKAPHVSMADFKLYCQHAFRQEALSSTKVYDPVGNPDWECCHCSRLVSDERNLHQHLFRDHKPYIVERIRELQTSVPVTDIKSLVEGSAEDKKALKWSCVRCGKGFVQECNLRRHIKYSCEYGPKLQALAYGCDECGRSFRCHADLRKHVDKVHENNLRDVSKDGASGTSVPDPMPKLDPYDCDAVGGEEESGVVRGDSPPQNAGEDEMTVGPESLYTGDSKIMLIIPD